VINEAKRMNVDPRMVAVVAVGAVVGVKLSVEGLVDGGSCWYNGKTESRDDGHFAKARKE
jgi:hypothetical protein